MRLIHGFFSAARMENGAYVVPIAPDTQHLFWVRLQFPKPLPALDDWPTKDSLEVGD